MRRFFLKLNQSVCDVSFRNVILNLAFILNEQKAVAFSRANLNRMKCSSSDNLILYLPKV